MWRWCKCCNRLILPHLGSIVEKAQLIKCDLDKQQPQIVAVSADTEVSDSWHQLPVCFRLLGAADADHFFGCLRQKGIVRGHDSPVYQRYCLCHHIYQTLGVRWHRIHSLISQLISWHACLVYDHSRVTEKEWSHRCRLICTKTPALILSADPHTRWPDMAGRATLRHSTPHLYLQRGLAGKAFFFF